MKSFSGSIPRYFDQSARLRPENTMSALRARIRFDTCVGIDQRTDISRSFRKSPGCRKPSSDFCGLLSVATAIACSSKLAFGFMSPLQFWRLTQRMRSVLL